MTNTTEKNDRRYMWNLCMFTISFVISNLVSGIIYDVYVNYLQEVWKGRGSVLLVLLRLFGIYKRGAFAFDSENSVIRCF